MATDLTKKVHKIKFVFSRADSEKASNNSSNDDKSDSNKQVVKKRPCVISDKKLKKHLTEEETYNVIITEAYVKNKVEYCTIIFSDLPDHVFNFVSYADIEFL